MPVSPTSKTGKVAAANATATAAAAATACNVVFSEDGSNSPLMSPGAVGMLLSGEAAANLLLPESAAETRAEGEGIAQAMPSNKHQKKRLSPSSGGVQTAQKAKATAKKQRAASAQQLAFETTVDSPARSGELQQQATAAQDVLEEHANCMQIRSEEEQPAAEQDTIQQAASAEKQQQDTAEWEIYQPIHHAVEPSEGTMEGQWWLPQDGTTQHEGINFASVQQEVNFGAANSETLPEATAAQESTTVDARADFSPLAADSATSPALHVQQQQQQSGSIRAAQYKRGQRAYEPRSVMIHSPA